MVNIAVLVSGGGTNLQAILDAEAAGRIAGGRVCCVISSRADAYALVRARNAGVPALCVARKDYGDMAAYGAALRERLSEFGADLVVLAGFLSILDAATVRAYSGRMLNIHPSLLPSFGGPGCYGLRVHEMALRRGVKVTGATVHFVTEEADAGPIVLQKVVDVREDDTPESLQKRVMAECEQVILPRAIDLFCRGLLAIEDGRVRILEKRRDP